ncbi:ricin-type beta-trefoil lectin domain protein [Streptomyces tubercidicus]|uniref:ricin-type beta-trefoil lectin domain protein n=1 Tax=Streptomyces tubercidicus TaxID=47759 RepID=UPI002E0E37FB|nr:tyrosine-type recombinase/integrase [Streptomyces tubercidicus]
MPATKAKEATTDACPDAVKFTRSADGGTMEPEVGPGQSARYGLVVDSGVCADSKSGEQCLVATKSCNEGTGDKLFVFAKDGTLHRTGGSVENECLLAPAEAGGQITRVACDPNNKAQQWKYDSASHVVQNPSTGWVMALGASVAGEDGFLLHAHHGSHVLDSNYRTEFRHAVIRVEFSDESWTAHTLRHLFASSAIGSGLSLLEVSRWLGHATIQITADIYGHLTPDAGARMRSVMDGALAAANVSCADS